MAIEERDDRTKREREHRALRRGGGEEEPRSTLMKVLVCI